MNEAGTEAAAAGLGSRALFAHATHPSILPSFEGGEEQAAKPA